MTNVKVTTTIEVELDPKLVAAWFWGLDDETQAQFFIELQAISAADAPNPSMQWLYMIGHLNTCSCSNSATRDMIKEWAEYIKDP